MTIRIKTNAADVARVLKEWGRKCPRSALKGCDVWARKTATIVKRVTPHSKASQLKKSIHGYGTMKRRSPVASIVAPVRHGIFVEFGTKPHGINPRKRRALAFIPRGGKGKIIIGPRLKKCAAAGRWLVRGASSAGLSPVRKFAVWHPGTKPVHFFFPTIKRELPKLGPAIWAAWRATMAKAKTTRR